MECNNCRDCISGVTLLEVMDCQHSFVGQRKDSWFWSFYKQQGARWDEELHLALFNYKYHYNLPQIIRFLSYLPAYVHVVPETGRQNSSSVALNRVII